ncbi:hypothetical protein B0T16DRAFT_10052 [Cercophora newfieldiana]|uniref:Protein kinase domain-containing protein n=1 Tax=Cercophora newfieldiana TaxID=92897 RepID=A0AA40CXT9_9PEZI|nr:hypothetical protein B0T16DRAFT_10052 [Cercophora newfieldiana]
MSLPFIGQPSLIDRMRIADASGPRQRKLGPTCTTDSPAVAVCVAVCSVTSPYFCHSHSRPRSSALSPSFIRTLALVHPHSRPRSSALSPSFIRTLALVHPHSAFSCWKQIEELPLATMDQVEELEQKLRASEQRAREFEQHIDKERQRADKERQRADEEHQRVDKERQRADKERQRADEEQSKNRPTCLDEYLEACHKLVFAKFTVQPNKSLTTMGKTTKPDGKMHPVLITPWSDFVAEEKAVLGKLFLTYSQKHVFESHSFLHGLGQRLARRKIGNEKALELFQHIAVEDPVNLIIDELSTDADVLEEFNIGSGIFFENHASVLSEWAEEVVDRQARRQKALQGTASPSPNRSNTLRPDQICAYQDGDSQRRAMAYLIEYKAPHKIPLAYIRSGLKGDLNVSIDAVNSPTCPAHKKVVIAALSQTFHYMIEGGLVYSFMTTGEAIVFLKIDWANPGILYYHIAEPAFESARAHPSHLRFYTAVTQVLSLTLMAFGPPGGSHRTQQSQDKRLAAKEVLPKWKVTLEDMLRSIPETPPRDMPESPEWMPSSVDRSPDYQTPLRRNRKSKKRPRAESKSPDRRPPPRDRRSPSRSGDESSPTAPLGARRHRGPAHPSLGDGGGGGGGGGSGSGNTRRGRNSDGRRQFCTHSCLSGMVQGGPLDPHCPNVALHQTAGHGRHPINYATWLRLMHEQLGRTLDDGISPTGKEGARAAMFQVTLLQHGYTVVGKGTVSAFVEDLEHEAAVYQQLAPLQGADVPVHLGAVDLKTVSRTYYYDHGVRITYIMFLSWGGHTLSRRGIDLAEKQELLALVGRIHDLGVLHRDVRRENLLQDPHTGRFMAIDFERAVIHRPERRSRRTTNSVYASQPCSAASHPLAAADRESVQLMLNGHLVK